MRLLLDTHIVWWLIAEPEKLRRSVSDALGEKANELCYTPLSLLELAIKRAKGGMTFDAATLLAGMGRLRMREVPVRQEHAIQAGELPPIHKDPFDRLMIAQAMVERMTLVSADGVFPRYDVPLIAG